MFFRLFRRNCYIGSEMEAISETLHLAAGSVEPEPCKDKNILRFYNMRFCPYAQRTRLVLSAKKIPHEIVNINLVSKPEWYFKINPLGKVPCVLIEGNPIYESLVTADLLDELYPNEGPLNPTDPVLKALDRIQLEHYNKVTSLLYKLFRSKGLPDEDTLLASLFTGLDHFESELQQRKTSFFGGEKPRMLDYMIWPWFERIAILPQYIGQKSTFPRERFTRLEAWIEGMKEDPAVRVSYFAPEVHLRFIESFVSGNPTYELNQN